MPITTHQLPTISDINANGYLFPQEIEMNINHWFHGTSIIHADHIERNGFYTDQRRFSSIHSINEFIDFLNQNDAEFGEQGEAIRTNKNGLVEYIDSIRSISVAPIASKCLYYLKNHPAGQYLNYYTEITQLLDYANITIPNTIRSPLDELIHNTNISDKVIYVIQKPLKKKDYEWGMKHARAINNHIPPDNIVSKVIIPANVLGDINVNNNLRETILFQKFYNYDLALLRRG